jgi:hypothetical protein
MVSWTPYRITCKVYCLLSVRRQPGCHSEPNPIQLWANYRFASTVRSKPIHQLLPHQPSLSQGLWCQGLPVHRKKSSWPSWSCFDPQRWQI